MKITKITIKPIEADTLRAFASVEFDSALVVTGFRIVDGKKGLFVTMPQRVGADKDGKDTYYDVVYPTSKKGRDFISNKILEEFESGNDEVDNPFE